MFSSLSEASWLADQAAPGPQYLGTASATRPFLDGDDFSAEITHTHTFINKTENPEVHSSVKYAVFSIQKYLRNTYYMLYKHTCSTGYTSSVTVSVTTRPG